MNGFGMQAAVLLLVIGMATLSVCLCTAGGAPATVASTTARMLSLQGSTAICTELGFAKSSISATETHARRSGGWMVGRSCAMVEMLLRTRWRLRGGAAGGVRSKQAIMADLEVLKQQRDRGEITPDDFRQRKDALKQVF